MTLFLSKTIPSSPFNQSFIKLMNSKLEKYHTKKINQSLSKSVYQDVYNVLTEILSLAAGSKYSLSHESLSYFTQLYYDCIISSDGQKLDTNTIGKLANLSKIDNKELDFYSFAFYGTDLAIHVNHEIKRRS